MKKLALFIVAALSILPLGMSAQSIGFSSAPRPGVSVMTSPYGTNVSFNSGLLDIVFASNGFYDCYGHFHKVGHSHSYNKHYCKACEKEYRKIRKEAEKHYKRHGNNGNHYGNNKHDNRPGRK